MSIETFKDVEQFEQIFEALSTEEFNRLRSNFGHLQAFEVIPKLFEDSTHYIFKLFFSDTPVPLICKLCFPKEHQEYLSNKSEASLSTTMTFWSRIRQLFGFDACLSLKSAHIHYQWMEEHASFHIAKLYGVAVSTKPVECGFLLQEFIEGVNCHRSSSSKERTKELAAHLMQMHQHHFESFGLLAKVIHEHSKINVSDKHKLKADSTELWWAKITQVIETIPAGKIPHSDKKLALKTIEALKVKRLDFVPQLVDFRWDQVRSGLPALDALRSSIGKSYLLDLDALVVAPLEFEWVMLELVLSKKDLDYLTTYFHHGLKRPLIHDHRLVYRLVLFSMNLLGEMSWETFKSQPQFLN